MLSEDDRAAVGRIAVYMKREASGIIDPRLTADLHAIAEDLKRLAGSRPLLRKIEAR